ncbi:glucosamine-6-phosphate deaminase [Vibrio sp. S9_S30]|uniref:glucosamine-6-phosphate deaminase n=1 Tax=Vibrio sp. S9_S30 TaxID=2720226 RepID=UPI001680BEC6|nr:glucosamine-6-phosphate deaminase [Vibrio sp. S9_S30]MBD1556619.1 glucosamine-6-phosphate deaminase [Vibrio sp. S9_S30]
MEISRWLDEASMGEAAAQHGARLVREAIERKGHANIILATGTSQFSMLSNLIVDAGIDWTKVSVFHLDEYVGLSDQHPASFRRYLRERVVEKLPNLHAITYVNGDVHPLHEELTKLNEKIAAVSIDVAFVGIGENGHLAFNDPPANFDVTEPYIQVDLDEACREQQLGEGWFTSMKEVPTQAISMSIQQILKSEHIVCTVPSKRKAQAVRHCLEGDISVHHPASVLQNHPSTSVFLDNESASLLHLRGQDE